MYLWKIIPAVSRFQRADLIALVSTTAKSWLFPVTYRGLWQYACCVLPCGKRLTLTQPAISGAET